MNIQNDPSRFTAARIKEVLDLHAKWVRGEKSGQRADLSDASLRGADLIGANLSGAYLGGANLSGACLGGADFGDAYLSGANLRGADFSGANLSGANLGGADFSGANLRNAHLSGSDVSHNRFVITATLGRYDVYAYIDRNGFRITAGCRKSLTLAEALEHWSPKNRGSWSEATKKYGERMTRIVRFLESEARLLGWDVDGSSEEPA